MCVQVFTGVCSLGFSDHVPVTIMTCIIILHLSTTLTPIIVNIIVYMYLSVSIALVTLA